ncbi:TNF11 factor, partial [Atractosteus spatula]|nr:TNF11 factor [Atractosteus spatula]
MAASYYRSYLRSPTGMENSQQRFDSGQNTEPTCRPLIFGTLVVMGLLQIASSVAILLHLTGHIGQVSSSCYSKKDIQTELPSLHDKPLESTQRGGLIADALKDPRKKDRSRSCKSQKDLKPSAHLTIRAPINFTQKGNIQLALIHWNTNHGLAHLRHLGYSDGIIKVLEGGFYYVYAKTCFRYYAGVSGDVLKDDTILIQYVHHEKQAQKTTIVLMKSGSTKHWNKTDFNLYCIQQGGVFLLKDGDGIYVKVSNSWLLDPEPEGSYFGAIKMSNLN